MVYSWNYIHHSLSLSLHVYLMFWYELTIEFCPVSCLSSVLVVIRLYISCCNAIIILRDSVLSVPYRYIKGFEVTCREFFSTYVSL